MLLHSEPVTLTCPCGAVFETRSKTRTLCDECRRKKRNEYNRAFIKEWHSKNKEKTKKYQERYREEHPRIKKPKEEAYPLRRLLCSGGCGAIVETRSRRDEKLCPVCKSKREAEKMKYTLPSGEVRDRRRDWDLRNPERKREIGRLWYHRNKEKLKQRALAKAGLILPSPAPQAEPPKPKVTALPPVKAAKPPRPKKEKTKAQKLPSEAEKLLMLRAAIRRYHGQ